MVRVTYHRNRIDKFGFVMWAGGAAARRRSGDFRRGV